VNQCQALAACRPNPGSARDSARTRLAPSALWKGTWKRRRPHGQGQHWSSGAVEHEFYPAVWGQGLSHTQTPPLHLPSSRTCISWVSPTCPGERVLSWEGSAPWVLWGCDLGSLRCRRNLGSPTPLQAACMRGLVGGKMETA